MILQLLERTQDAQHLIFLAARKCRTNAEAFDQLLRAVTRDSAYEERVVRFCIDNKHLGVLEHVKFTFYVEGVSTVLTHQLVRYRVASYDQESARHVPKQAETVSVAEISNNSEARQVYDEAMHHAYEAYNKLLAMNISLESARYVLPPAFVTSMMFTMNCRELLHFLEERLAPEAQTEIRELAEAVLKVCNQHLPVVFPMELLTRFQSAKIKK